MPDTAPLISSPLGVLATLLFVLAGLFMLQRHPAGARFFSVVPLLVFCYFVPTLLSNTGVIPLESETYTFIRRIVLPASLLLLVLATDIPAVISLGRDAVVLFLAGTASIALGGPTRVPRPGLDVPEGGAGPGLARAGRPHRFVDRRRRELRGRGGERGRRPRHA